MSCGAKSTQSPLATVEGTHLLPVVPTLLTTFCCWACFCRKLATSRHRASFSLQHTAGSVGPHFGSQG